MLTFFTMADEEGTWDSPAKVAELTGLGEKEGLALIFRSDECLLKRFLRARRGDAAAALAMLLAHQAWRRTETPWWPLSACPLEHIRSDWEMGKAYLAPFTDASGCTVAFVRAALHDKHEDRQQLKRFISFLNDEAVARLESSEARPRPEKMSIIVSFVRWQCPIVP